MSTLEQYLNEEYPEDEQDLEAIDRLLIGVSGTRLTRLDQDRNMANS